MDTITQSFTISVENTNDTPIANNMNVSTDEDTDFNISLNANDIDGDNLTIIIETDPVYSTIVSDGLNISVIPNQHFNGTDTFTYKVNDGTVNSNIATVSITVNAINDAPVLSTISDVSFDEDTTISIQINATDIENDTIIFIW